MIVGATGFEPAAAWSQTRSATGLRYAPLHIQELLAVFLNCECKGSTFFETTKHFCDFSIKKFIYFLKQRTLGTQRIHVKA